MPNEVFRFVLTRPVQRISAKTSRRAFAPYERTGDSAFIRSIEDARSPQEVTALAMARLASSDAVLAQKDATLDWLRRAEAATENGTLDPPSTAQRDALDRLTTDLADGLVAGMLLGKADPKRAHERMRLLRMASLLSDADAEQKRLSPEFIRRGLRTKLLLPTLELPLAPASSREKTPASKPTRSLEPPVSASELELAAGELRTLLGKRSFEEERSVTSDDGQRSRGFFGFSSTEADPPKAPLRDWRADVSLETRQTLTAARVAYASLDLDDAIHAVERVASRQMAPRPDQSFRVKAQKFGSGIGTGSFPVKVNPVPTDASGLNDPATVPASIGTLRRKRRGDLYIVRQSLSRYELGEIAHIENVLKGESNSRTFKSSQTSEDVLATSSETAITEEKDLQSTERFELASQTKDAVKDNLKLEAGFSITASYGPTVGVEAGTNFAYEHAQEKSQETATNYAREITNRAQSKIESRMSEQRTTRVVREVEEITLHGIDNKGGAGHVQGVYRWVEKVYEAQLINYGIRDLYDFYVPEPAAFFKHARAGQEVEGVSMDAPTPPMVNGRPLQPSDIQRDHYVEWVGLYGVSDAVPPPPASLVVSGMIEKGAAQGDNASAPGSKVSTELMVPEGYVSTTIKVNGYGYRAVDNNNWGVVAGGRQFSRSDDGHTRDFGSRTDKIPAALVHYGYSALCVSISLSCECTPEHFAKWQLQIFSSIMQGYQRLKSEYDEQVARARDAVSASIHGRSPQSNEKTMRDELKRAVVSLITGQRFELFNSMRGVVPPHGYPEIAFEDADAEGDYVAFTEQAFEWENMTFLFYPYFWGRKSGWPEASQLEDGDYLFEQFLKAGFARVQVPVRPGFESRVDYAFDPANAGGHVWPGEDPPGFDNDGLTIEEEMRFQTGGANFVQGPGFVTVTAGNEVIVGNGTEFTDDDIDRELRVGSTTFHIIAVIDATHVRVAPPTPAADFVDTAYGLGAKLAGLPWEIKVPTTLVYLQPDALLNP
jgi:hypothetical protein